MQAWNRASTPCPRRRKHRGATAAARMLPLALGATEWVVPINTPSAPLGQLGRFFLAGPAGSPMDSSGARQGWRGADARGVTCCRCGDSPETACGGDSGHELHDEQRVDTHLIAMPNGQWDGCNSASPGLRAPRFSVATLNVAAVAKAVAIAPKVAQ